MSGIVETRESLIAIVVLGKYIASLGADGFDFQDVAALVQKLVLDENFKEILAAGVKGLDAVPVEIQEIDIQEALELVGLLIEALRK